MGRIDLPYCQPVDAKGRTYYYYRRAGIRQRIFGEPGTIEFMECYQRIHESFENGKSTPGALPGSFEALARTYLRSPEFNQLGDRAQAEYRSYIEPMRERFGKLLIRGISRRVVLAYRDTMQKTPSKANHAIKVFRLLLNFAVNREWLDRNPASGIPTLKTGDGWQAWPEAALANAHKKLTGSARMGFMLAHYTGQRKGDVLAMRWDAIEGNGIHVKQQKTGKMVWIPLHPVLAEEIAKIKRKGVAILGRRDGAPYTISGFNRIWRRQQEKHGFKGLQFHGLRRNAVNALLEAGCEIAEVSAITGQSFEMVQHYAQEVNQKHLATTAMNKWQTAGGKPTGKLSIIGGRDDG